MMFWVGGGNRMNGGGGGMAIGLYDFPFFEFGSNAFGITFWATIFYIFPSSSYLNKLKEYF
jgi:hypothetical protein